jgi:hypothetical protein
MSWLRLYTDILNDPKVQNLPPETFKSWINVLLVAKTHGDPHGYLPDIDAIAFRLRISPSEASSIIENLKSINLLDQFKSGIKPHNWNGRQYISDVSTERVKRHRKRQRNVSVTPPEQNRTEQKDKEAGAKAPKKVSNENLFLEFWEVYPRKVARGDALKAYLKALSRASHAEILAGVKRYKPDPKFTKHPATWLNADCWLDEAPKSNGSVARGPWKPLNGPAMADEPPPVTHEERQRRDEVLRHLKARAM